MYSIACCEGFIDEGIPKGKVEQINNIKCYIATADEMKNPKLVVVIATDVFGYEVPNVRLIADAYAQELGCICVIPDVFDGKPASEKAMIKSDPNIPMLTKLAQLPGAIWSFSSFLVRHREAAGVKAIEQVIRQLRQNGYEKVVLQGYCWGGSIAIKMATTDLIDVCAVAHPGTVQLPKDVDSIGCPIIFVFAENDIFLSKGIDLKIKSGLEVNSKCARFELKTYPGTNHGFAVRGDEHDPNVKKMREQAFRDTLDFIRLNLTK